MVSLVAAAGFALPLSVNAACEISGPAMLDLYLAGRELGEATRRLLEPAARHSPQALSRITTVDAAMGALNTQLWGLYWVSLYNRRMLEVLEQVDANREVSPTGPVRAYYARWSASQLANSAALALRAAEAVGAAVTAAETEAAAAIPPPEAAKLRQYANRAGNELQGCAPPR